MKKFLFKYSIILLGLIIFGVYFWNRFIHSQNSKNLPLILNIISLGILIYICILFIYLIYNIMFPRKPNIIVEKITNLMFTPLKELDIYIKNISYISPYYYKTIKILFEKIEKMIINSNKFFIIFWAIPRLILLTTLFLDVFIFNRFHYKYMVILFGLLLFLNKYIMYSLKYYKKQLMEEYSNNINYVLMDYIPNVHPSEFEDNYNEDDDEPTPTMALPFDIYIEFQTKSIVYNNDKKEVLYISESTSLRKHFWLTHIGHAELNTFNKKVPDNYSNIFGNNVPDNYNQAKEFVQQKIDEHIKKIEQSVIRISLVIEYYKKATQNNFKIKLFKIFIYISYLICWGYVLYISLKIYTPSSSDIYMFWQGILSFQEKSEPFSGLLIESISEKQKLNELKLDLEHE